MKNLFVIKSPSAGGAETYLLRFLTFCSDSDNEVLCKGSVFGDLADPYKRVTTLISIGSLGLLNPLPYYKLYKYLKKEGIRSICDFSGNFSGWVLFVAKLAGVQTRLAFYRESRNQFTPSFFRTCYAKLIKYVMYHNATKILSNSEAALNYFHPNWRLRKDFYNVIYNGIDLTTISKKSKNDARDMLNLPREAFVFCHSGRYVAAKNHDMIINCAIKLCQKYSDIHFVLIGKGVDDKYRDHIEDCGLSNNIHLLGYRNDVMDLLQCADCYYFPSLNEGQPNALIEAMVSGLPFIGSDIAPIREATPDTLHSFLVNPTDELSNLSMLERAYKDQNFREGLKCTDWAQNNFEASLLFYKFKAELI